MDFHDLTARIAATLRPGWRVQRHSTSLRHRELERRRDPR